MEPLNYFRQTHSATHKQYEVLRAFFLENMTAEEVAEIFDYSPITIYSLVKDFRKRLKTELPESLFFKQPKKGRAFRKDRSKLFTLIIALRKKNFAVPDIKAILDAQNILVSEGTIFQILRQDGFARLPRRDKVTRTQMELPKIKAKKSEPLDLSDERFSSSEAGLLCLLPYLKKYFIDRVIEESSFPETAGIDRRASIYAFLALKLSHVRRYSVDDMWCMDRGLGLFAGLNVLPKTAWFSSYSHRVTREMNRTFLRALHCLWQEHQLLGDTINLDFTTIPYWGENSHLENNWSGKQHQALASILAVLAQDPDSGIIDYGDTDVLHKNKPAVVLEFLDFYKEGYPASDQLKYLVFDSKFTTYENLRKLDDNGIKFITIRRRGKNIVEAINELPASKMKRIRVPCAGNKSRLLAVYDDKVKLKKYGDIRQIVITGHGKIKPALIITNDEDLPVAAIVRKYCRRWLVEKGISEQIEFFHLNRVSSSMVIKVDFDLTMTILAHNVYRLLAMDLERYSHLTAISLYEKFIMNSGEVIIEDDVITVKLKKKRNLPAVLMTMKNYENIRYPLLSNKRLVFEGATIS